jgi:hypothetical protein
MAYLELSGKCGADQLYITVAEARRFLASATTAVPTREAATRHD